MIGPGEKQYIDDTDLLEDEEYLDLLADAFLIENGCYNDNTTEEDDILKKFGY